MPLPFGLVQAGGTSSYLATASAWAAKALFTSNASISPILRPVRLSTLRVAGTGRMPMIPVDTGETVSD
jgi:hypothetical protein